MKEPSCTPAAPTAPEGQGVHPAAPCVLLVASPSFLLGLQPQTPRGSPEAEEPELALNRTAPSESQGSGLLAGLASQGKVLSTPRLSFFCAFDKTAITRV